MEERGGTKNNDFLVTTTTTTMLSTMLIKCWYTTTSILNWLVLVVAPVYYPFVYSAKEMSAEAKDGSLSTHSCHSESWGELLSQSNQSWSYSELASALRSSKSEDTVRMGGNKLDRCRKLYPFTNEGCSLLLNGVVLYVLGNCW